LCTESQAAAKGQKKTMISTFVGAWFFLRNFKEAANTHTR